MQRLEEHTRNIRNAYNENTDNIEKFIKQTDEALKNIMFSLMRQTILKDSQKEIQRTAKEIKKDIIETVKVESAKQIIRALQK